MLDNLVTKAKTTVKKYWKWILGVLIALIVAYVAWRLKRQQDELEILQAEKLMFEVKARDLKAQADNEKDAQFASKLREKAESYEAAAAEKETTMQQIERDVEAAKESVQNAQDWQALEKEAKGDTK